MPRTPSAQKLPKIDTLYHALPPKNSVVVDCLVNKIIQLPQNLPLPPDF
jgi:hypothetical protein